MQKTSIVLEYLFIISIIIIIIYSVIFNKDIPHNTMIVIKWLGVTIVSSVSGQKITNEIYQYKKRRENDNNFSNN